MNETAIIVADNEILVVDLAELARERGLHLITNGVRTALSPVVPSGWSRLGVVAREHHHVH